MFAYAEDFSADISKWDVSHVKDMSSMFYCAAVFNGDISLWDVSKSGGHEKYVPGCDRIQE